MQNQAWYIAILVLECDVEGPPAEPLVDLQLRLVRACDPANALRSAEAMGLDSQHAYLNAEGEEVRWVFRGLHDLRATDDPEPVHGAEVYSRFDSQPATDLVTSRAQLSAFGR
jgi:hypothetical protein